MKKNIQTKKTSSFIEATKIDNGKLNRFSLSNPFIPQILISIFVVLIYSNSLFNGYAIDGISTPLSRR